VQVVSWSDAACPDTQTILTYSESSNPSSSHYSDQTALFSRKAWVQERFCQADVLGHTLGTTKLFAPTPASRRRRRPTRRRAGGHPTFTG
jgi:hypothetical protein